MTGSVQLRRGRGGDDATLQQFITFLNSIKDFLDFKEPVFNCSSCTNNVVGKAHVLRTVVPGLE